LQTKERLLGLIGGVSWQSSALYYAHINEEIHKRLGHPHSANMVLRSLDFAPFVKMKTKRAREQAIQQLCQAAASLENSGCSTIILCSNTLHAYAEEIQRAISCPFLHIADPLCQAITQQHTKTVALLGTEFTMEGRFMRDKLAASGITCLIPEGPLRRTLHNIITEELIQGIVTPQAKETASQIIEGLVEKGAEGVVLGCTELPLLITPDMTDSYLFDTTRLHAIAASEHACKTSERDDRALGRH
jgi:aspartate racemase